MLPLESCCQLLLGVGRGHVKKLEDTNNYILRSIWGPVIIILNMVGLKTLQQGRQFQALVLAIISVSITKPQAT